MSVVTTRGGTTLQSLTYTRDNAGRIRRKVYRTRAGARQDMFDYIEMFHNPTRKHARNGMLSPVEFERQYKIQTEGV